MKEESFTSYFDKSQRINDLCMLFNVSNRILPMPDSILALKLRSQELGEVRAYKPFTLPMLKEDTFPCLFDSLSDQYLQRFDYFSRDQFFLSQSHSTKASPTLYQMIDNEFLKSHIAEICKLMENKLSSCCTQKDEDSCVKLIDNDEAIDVVNLSYQITAGKRKLVEDSLHSESNCNLRKHLQSELKEDVELIQTNIVSCSKGSAFEEYIPISTSCSQGEDKSSPAFSSRKSSDGFIFTNEKIAPASKINANNCSNKRLRKAMQANSYRNLIEESAKSQKTTDERYEINIPSDFHYCNVINQNSSNMFDKEVISIPSPLNKSCLNSNEIVSISSVECKSDSKDLQSEQLSDLQINCKSEKIKSSQNRKTKKSRNRYGEKEDENETLKGFKFRYRYLPNAIRKKRVIVCCYENCSMEFKKTWNYIDHAYKHLNIKPFVCEYCDKSFTQKGNFKRHITIHKPKGSKLKFNNI